MRATAVRRTALAASAAALTLLATACGGASDADGKDGKKDDKAAAAGSSSAPKAPAKTLSADELDKAALAQGDVEGTKITKAGAAEEVPADGVKVDKKECLPVAHAMYGVAQEGSSASAKRKVIDEPKADGKKKSLEELAEGGADDVFKDAFNLTATLVALHSYEGTAGADAFSALKKAAADCAGGYTATVAGEPTKIVSVAEEKVAGGDESAAWTLTMEDDEGDKAPLKLAALRKGNSVATFHAFNMAAAADGGVKFELPAEVVAAQDKKLG